MEDDTTLPDSDASVRGAERSLEGELDRRYDLGAVIGRGGMGEVRLARDTRIEREVAVKLMRHGHEDRDLVARFFREARVQGSLEHPAVVPVHDLGIDHGGNPYFVMKRLAGTTLADVIARGDRNAWPRRLLLTRLVDVCLAIELAHRCGVVHRDLKPANIMLGDYGEAYVLDWGLARIVGEDSAVAKIQAISGEDGHTGAGELLGTPGYMPPEQARGESVDARADVFALGCVLYEILAGQPALPRGLAAITETLSADEHRPTAKVADVPPELDDLCARATAADRAARPTARELADRIQAYLDGDRDLERRRELASTHAQRAMAAFIELGDAARAEAMRGAGHALALDPSNADAASILSTLMIEAPTSVPAAALASADQERGTTRQQVLRGAGIAYLVIAPALAVLFAFPVHHLWPILLSMGLLGVTGVVLLVSSRRPLPMRSPLFLLAVALNTGALTSAGLIFGPLFILPIFITGSLAGYLAQPTRYPAWLILVAHGSPMLLLLGLELAQVLPATFEIQEGTLVLSPWVVDLTPVATLVVFSIAMVAQFANTTVVALSGRRAQEEAQNRLHAQQWHLEQLVPRDVIGAKRPGSRGR